MQDLDSACLHFLADADKLRVRAMLCLYAVNLDRLRSRSPFFMINQIRTTIRIETPASREQAGPIPRLVKKAWPKRGKTEAVTERKRVLPARIEAAY